MEDLKEPRKKKLKRTYGKVVTQSKWFVVASEEEMEQISKGFVPKNTKKTTNWAVKVFEQWRVQRNEATNDNGKLCPSNILECPKVRDLNYWLSRFVIEARSENGDPTPLPHSLTSFLGCTVIAGNITPLVRTS